MPRFALSAVGRDRPGIVSAVSEVLLRHGANVEDSRMAILGGHFTIMLIVETPDGGGTGDLRDELKQVANTLGLVTISLAPVEGAGTSERATHIVSVYGADHPGIVHSVAAELAARDITIADLATRRVDDLYSMLLEIVVPAGTDVEEIAGSLATRGAEQGVEVTLRLIGANDL